MITSEINMECSFVKIRNHFGQSMFDQLLTEFAQQRNLYVDEIKVDEWHIYGSSRLGVYEANRNKQVSPCSPLEFEPQNYSLSLLIGWLKEKKSTWSKQGCMKGGRGYFQRPATNKSCWKSNRNR
ncbi:MAG: hypothetical protein L6Q78_14150 [Bacteroidia bacterium]|nr:hypothetical protein [Bacteroidia bacterium]